MCQRLALHLDLLHFEIGDRGLEVGSQLTRRLSLVDQARVVEIDEDLEDRARKPSSMVKRSRDQSQEAPRRCSWL